MLYIIALLACISYVESPVAELPRAIVANAPRRIGNVQVFLTVEQKHHGQRGS